jgi:hypothetical protein
VQYEQNTQEYAVRLVFSTARRGTAGIRFKIRQDTRVKYGKIRQSTPQLGSIAFKTPQLQLFIAAVNVTASVSVMLCGQTWCPT